MPINIERSLNAGMASEGLYSLRIETGYLATVISLNERLLLKKSSWFGMRRLYEFETDGAQYKVRFRWSINVFRNLGLKCYVERDGQLIADNPHRSEIYVRNLLMAMLIGGVLGAASGLVVALIGIFLFPAPGG